MSSIMEGLSAALNSVFGAAVTIRHADGSTAVLTGVFREESLENDVGDGRLQVSDLPTLRLQKNQVPTFEPTDRIEPAIAAGRSFRILRPLLTGNPGSDAFIIYMLEEVL